MNLEVECLSLEECREFAALMGQKYAGFIDEKYFEATIDADGYGVFAKVILRNKSGSFYYPVEGRLAYVDQKLNQRDAGLLLIDYIDLYFKEYLDSDEGVLLPIDWADYECDGVHLQLRGQILNLEMERMADEWLAGRGVEQTH